jgi:two-component system OmpR family sensor kinase
MSRLTIRLRLTLAFAVAMAAVLAGVGLLVYHRIGNELLASVDQTLRAQAAEAVGHAGQESHLVDQDTAGGTTLAQLLGPDGRPTLSQPTGLAPLLSPREAARAEHGPVLLTTHVAGRRGEWRVLARPVDSAGVVAVARPLSARAESLDHLRHELSLILPLALLASSVGGYLLAAGALRPVEAMRRRAAAVTAERPGRLPVPAARDEISRLALTLNDMLARLQAAFEHERRFVADASHELRTPLALLQTELDLALRRPRSNEELAAALRSAADETRRLSRLADDLLLLARADQDGIPLRPEPVAVDDLLRDVAGRFGTRAGELGRTVRAEPSGAVVQGDPLRLEQALGNLVDNALTHGGGDVVLSAEARDGVVELHARDGGTGFPEPFLERAFDRFSRADEARGRGGSGLGLSIVQLVAQAHGGRAGVRNLPGAGADVWLELPGSDRVDPAPSPQGDGKTPDRGGRGRRGRSTRDGSMHPQETSRG